MTIVRRNLMTRKGYAPYCGNSDCRTMPRAQKQSDWQFKCSCCGWVSEFPQEFINELKEKWEATND